MKRILFSLARSAYSLLSWSALHDENARTKEIKVRRLLAYGTGEGIGHYASFAVEKFYTDIAQSRHVELSSPQAGTCLLVFTRSWFTGGHTRVAERWIEVDKSRQYSIAFTDAHVDEIPVRLRDAVQSSGGSLIFVYRGSELESGLELRRLSSRFESVVLFAHMYDVVPLIAFGTSEFKTPVGFYNHADHRFWLGVSIADLVGELRDWGRDLSYKYRGVRSQVMIGVPSESIQVADITKSFARQKLGLERDALIVTCVGRYAKMLPANGVNMLSTVRRLLEWDERLVFLMVGISEDQICGWSEVAHSYLGRLKCFAEVPHNELKFYHLAADIVLDSRPMGGITALADALWCRRPILSCMKSVDWIAGSSACCVNDDDVLAKAKSLLQLSDIERQEIAKEQLKILEKLSGNESFKKKIDEFLGRLLAVKHVVRSFSAHATPYLDADRFYASRKTNRWYVGMIIRMVIFSSSFLINILNLEKTAGSPKRR